MFWYVFRIVSDHAALVSDTVCERHTHSDSAANVGLILLRRINRLVSGHTRHAENEGSFIQNSAEQNMPLLVAAIAF